MAYDAKFTLAPTAHFYYDLELGLPRTFTVPLTWKYRPDWCVWSIQGSFGVFLDALATTPAAGPEIAFNSATGVVTVDTNNFALDGTSVTLYFTAKITDGPLSLITPSVVTVHYITDCNTSVLSLFTIPTITTQYDIPSIKELAIPNDSWAISYA